MAEDENYKKQATEDNLNYKSISCEQIPELFLDKLVAKKHFSKFGRINRFILRPKRLCCTVEFETEEDAELAYMEAGHFNGIDFLVNYSELEKGHVHNTEEWVDPDVQAELEAMNPGIRYVATASSIMRPSAALTYTPPPQPPLPMAKMMAPRLAAPPPAAATSSPRPPPKSVAVDAPRVDANVRAELEALLRRPAYTYEDKYRVLDARDKLIRLTTVRQTDIKTAVSTKGTCPDMCPEKERLMREFQRQVASFEMSNDDDNDSSTISHRRAIKEYSRSSADQEVPLTHELRSESVLQLTMLYLMHRILDLCDDPQTSLADWFHFVWDRMRSIRKDITQQELCSLGAVQLVEQCARFHIHCAARLVAEDPSVFDKKINAENLTKCLQTLKYMYHDLRIKGVHCPCEAEFRSYIVLLNLGDANFLWELKQLPEHIQHSTAIKRAIAFYNALQNNNYVRFFDTIRAPETSYLSACILLGYIYRLRLHAMEVIIKSHNWRKNPVFIPLVYLTRVLGFEDEPAAADFFGYHGLQCDEERVMLERMTRPDGEYTMDRALMLVECKRTVSVGECVCGHVLDSDDILERHQPHNSFELNGLLKPESWTADDQLRGEAAAVKSAERKQQQTTTRAAAQQQIRTHTALQPPPPTIRTDTNLFKVPQSISPKLLQQQKFQQQQQQQQKTSSIFGGNHFGSGDFKTPPATQTATAAATIFKLSNDGSEGPFGTTSSSPQVFKIPSIDAASAKKPAADMPSSASVYFSSIFQSNSEKSTVPVAAGGASIFGGGAATIATASATPSDGNIFGAALKQTGNIFQQQPLAPEPLRQDNIFQHFQTQAADVGGAHQLQPPASTMKSIFASAASELNAESKMRLETETKQRNDAEKRMRELEVEAQRKQQQLDAERAKLRDLEEERARALAAKERQKALNALQMRAEKETQLLLQTLLVAEIRTLAETELAQRQALELHCAELSRELLAEVVTAQIADTASEEYAVMCHDEMLLTRYFSRWSAHTRRKLQQRKLMESTPIWATTETRAEKASQLLHPGQRQNLQMIKRYRYGEPCDFKALMWQDELSEKSTPKRKVVHSDDATSVALEMQALPCWLETQLGEQMWLRWHESTLQNPAFNKICTLPQHVLGIYNEAVDRLQEILAEDLQEMPDIPAELHDIVPPLSAEMPRGMAHFPRDWKNPARQQSILRFLQKLHLPAFLEQPPTELEALELWLLNYSSVCIPHDDARATQAAYQAIQALIKELNRVDLQPYYLEERFGMISYLPVMKALVFAHVNYIFESSAPAHIPTELIYRRQALLDYQQQPWWLNYKAIEAVTVDYTHGGNECMDTSETTSETSAADWTTILEEAEAVSRKANDNLRVLAQESLDSSADKCELTRGLDESLYRFELAKQIGVFDTSYAADGALATDLDGDVGGNVYISPLGKRKREPTETKPVSEMDAIMAKAFNLIGKVESQKDRALQARLQLAKRFDSADLYLK